MFFERKSVIFRHHTTRQGTRLLDIIEQESEKVQRVQSPRTKIHRRVAL